MARGVSVNVEALCAQLGLTHSAVVKRIQRGWTEEMILSTPRYQRMAPRRVKKVMPRKPTTKGLEDAAHHWRVYPLTDDQRLIARVMGSWK